MRPNPGRRDRAEPPARRTCDFIPEEERELFGGRVAGRLGAVLLAVILLGACGASTTPSPAAPSPATTPTPIATPSPAAVTDQALVDDLTAALNPYDAAKVAALYAPNAVLHEVTDANMTLTGLEAIQARFKSLAASDFKAVVTSAPIRQDNWVAVFNKWGTGSDLSTRGLVVYELKDGKILTQWVYQQP
jgi:hypothetical protein